VKGLEGLAGRMPSAQAGYMELSGARKDGDCEKVEVAGGISQARGCCNEFRPESSDTQKFSCGSCEYHREKSMIKSKEEK
jgi:hypothetical protein